MTTRKWILAMLIVLLAAGPLFGSGQTESGDAGGSGGEMDVVRVWTGERHTQAFMEAQVEQFNETIGQDNGFQLEYEVYGENYGEVYELALQTDQAPEILAIWGNLTPHVEAGNIVPIEQFDGSDEFLASFPQDQLVDGWIVFDDQTYSVPTVVYTTKLVYNKDLFIKAGITDADGNPTPPETIAELVEYARIITEQGEGKEYGIAVPIKSGGYFWDWLIQLPFIPSIGQPYWDVQNGEWGFEAWEPFFTEYFLPIKEDESYFPGAEILENDPARAQFSEGNIGMIWAQSWDIGVFTEQFPAKIEWGVADIPVLDPDQAFKEPVKVDRGLCLTSAALNADMDQVFEVYQWLHGPEIAIGKYERGLDIPSDPRIIAQADESLVSQVPHLAEFSNFNADNSFSFATWPSMEFGFPVQEGQNYYDVFTRIWLGEVEPMEALRDLDRRYNAQLQKEIDAGRLDVDLYTDPSFDISRD